MQSQAEHSPIPQPVDRETVLRQLLPYDYEYAVDSGLLDRFHFDPGRGEDSVLHILGGDHVNEDGLAVSHGFHHEPSGPIVWGESGITRVDREHLSELNGQKRRSYEEHLAEPYLSQVVIGGIRKFSLHKDPDTGDRRLVPAKNSMYPKEYDPLMVLQGIRIASENIDASKDRAGFLADGRAVITREGAVPLIDGETPMTVRMVVNADTGKIMTAMPVVPRKPGLMKLTPGQFHTHITGVDQSK